MKTILITIAQENTKNAEAFQNLLEQVHSSLSGEKVSFEMIMFGQSIGFCITASSAVCSMLEGQIYAMNADMDIKIIPDPCEHISGYDIFSSCNLDLEKSDLLPIKTYTDFESDSLSGVLNVLSKVRPGEGAFLQIVTTPQDDSGWFHWKLKWRKSFFNFTQKFWVKYWFKKGMTPVFEEQINKKLEYELFQCSIRILTFGKQKNKEYVPVRLDAISSSLLNFNEIDLNRFTKERSKNLEIPKKSEKTKHEKLANNFLSDFQNRKLSNTFLLASRELASLFHLPNEREVPNLLHVTSRKAEPPSDLPVDHKDQDISFFGNTNFHGTSIPFGIKRSDRRRHLYTVGKSGSGKSKLLELLIQNDINQGKGVGVLDPHGDLVDNILRIIPEHRKDDVIIFDPADTQFPISFNPLADVPADLKIRVTIGFIEIFKKLFGADWTPRLEHVLRYTTLALLDTPNTTILSILKMLTDKNYRQSIVRNIKDNVVKNFWTQEFAGWSEKFDAEAITPLLNKVGQFVATNMIRNIVGQPHSKLDFRDIMDNKKIVLMKVSKGILGEENAALLGAIAITKIYQAAMSRADTREEDREDFYFYVDEFQNFATDTFDEILSEARKYRLNLTIAHQFLGQLSTNIRTTVFGNVGSMISFRVGGEDAGILADEYNPRFAERDIINLGVREFYCKISIEGELREAFSGRTQNMSFPEKDLSRECVELSRKKYCKSLEEVEKILSQWEEGADILDESENSDTKQSDECAEFDAPLI
ncbi:TPA: type IV secretory system conjugative DNA transfer family protein [Candidatus Gracilibacteria bacterium]|nr:type IV secretory system conjugative DNA transfer family protein [Candidatus Gracilibacteria bacterium]